VKEEVKSESSVFENLGGGGRFNYPAPHGQISDPSSDLTRLRAGQSSDSQPRTVHRANFMVDCATSSSHHKSLPSAENCGILIFTGSSQVFGLPWRSQMEQESSCLLLFFILLCLFKGFRGVCLCLYFYFHFYFSSFHLRSLSFFYF
jgi:hypothetical protein